jgi:hypothetical protein
VKRSLLFWCAFLSLLAACVPRPPAIPYAETPATPLVQALEAQRARFSSLKALARVETERKGRRRVYESVAIIERGFERLRVEGYGPLGSSLFTLVWDGTTIHFLPSDGSGVRTIGQAGLERIIGVSLAPADLCAVFAGSSPRIPDGGLVEAGCSPDGRCALDIMEQDGRWRVHAQREADASGAALHISAVERYRGSTLIFIVRYEGLISSGGYALPAKVIVQNPGRGTTLTVDYLDAGVNVPVDEGVFMLTGSAP